MPITALASALASAPPEQQRIVSANDGHSISFTFIDISFNLLHKIRTNDALLINGVLNC
jgi:hypothetical protein